MKTKFAAMASKPLHEGRLPNTITAALSKRRHNGSLRSLVDLHELIDFSSNDYLGLARNRELITQVAERIRREESLMLGATGSRLISGNNQFFEKLESRLAEIFQAEAALLYNSGYAANQGFLSAVGQKGDTILYDQLAHVCIKEGAWLSKAESFSFRHNDLEDLEAKLQRASGNVYIATETVFSMDGDIAPLEAIALLCKKYGAFLVVDEAHSTGAYGPGGAGLLIEQGLADRVFARIYTFGKAMGMHGAVVVGPSDLKQFLINFSRSFIYTTSLPPHSVISLDEVFTFLASHMSLQQQLKERVELFRSNLRADLRTDSHTAIQPVLIPGNDKCREVALKLQTKGFDVRAILAPTVKAGSERLRVSLHVHNSTDQITQLAELLNELI